MKKIIGFMVLCSCSSMAGMQENNIPQGPDQLPQGLDREKLVHQVVAYSLTGNPNATREEIINPLGIQPIQEPLWVTEDRMACDGISPEIVRNAAIDTLAKPGTFLPQLRSVYRILKELTDGNLPSHQNLIRLAMLRHISPDAISESMNNPAVPMSYGQNLIHQFGGSVRRLTYNKDWEKAPQKTYAQLYAELEKENGGDVYFKCRDTFADMPHTAPLGHSQNNLNVMGAEKTRSTFEQEHKEPTLTRNIEQLCQRVNWKPIVFNLKTIVDSVNDVVPTEDNSLRFEPNLKHLTKEELQHLANQLPLGIVHLKAFNEFLELSQDKYENAEAQKNMANVISMQKKLVPVMLEQWKATMAKCPKQQPSTCKLCEVL